MIFDLHCDTLYELWKRKKSGLSASLRESDLAVDEKKLFRGGYTAQCFAAWVTEKCENPYGACLEMIDIFCSEVGKSYLLAPVCCYSDIEKNRNEGKISAILSLEDTAAIGTDMERLYTLYERGVRMIGLVWNYPNGVGYPNLNNNIPKNEFTNRTPNEKDGLTAFGCELIREMNRLGVVIDVSHLSDAGFYEVARISNKPFLASHSNSRAVCPHVRNLSDAMLKVLAECGGAVGINYCAAFRDSDTDRGNKTAECAIRHIKHIGGLIGCDHIALGSDFDGIPKGTEIDSADGMPKLVRALEKCGFSENEIEKITYKNALRVFRENL